VSEEAEKLRHIPAIGLDRFGRGTPLCRQMAKEAFEGAGRDGTHAHIRGKKG
jgi:hypothetical protein